jgi:hypothetical protein
VVVEVEGEETVKEEEVEEEGEEKEAELIIKKRTAVALTRTNNAEVKVVVEAWEAVEMGITGEEHPVLVAVVERRVIRRAA